MMQAYHPSTDQSVADYARRAFSVVLDEHELPIPPNEVGVLQIHPGRFILSYTSPALEAWGTFNGTDCDGVVTLTLIKKMDPKRGAILWECNFQTVDRLCGTDGNGFPLIDRRRTAEAA